MSAVSAVPAKRLLDIRRPSVNGLLVSVLAIPLLWVLGLSLITWVLLAFCLALGLSVRHDWLADRSFGWWLAFIVCVAASSVAVPDTPRFEAYLYRLVMYVAAAVFFIYGYTRVRNGAPVAKITQILVIYWGMIVVGGFLGLLLPGVTINSVAAHYAPDSLSNNEFVSVFLHPRFAQVQDFRNLGFPRPATLFGYTNGWGSAYAILTPLAIGLTLSLRNRMQRRAMWAALALSVIPAVLSVNRGLWLSLGVGILFVALHHVRRSAVQVARVAIAISVLAVIAFAFTPLGDVVQGRINQTDPAQEQSRLSRDRQALNGILQSPILGHGAPQPNPIAGRPSIGTESEIFLLGFSSGIPALIAFFGFFVVVLRRMHRGGAPPGTLWAQASIVVFLAQTPYYEMTAQLPIVMLVAGAVIADSIAAQRPEP